jgi:hypothetical protein
MTNTIDITDTLNEIKAHLNGLHALATAMDGSDNSEIVGYGDLLYVINDRIMSDVMALTKLMTRQADDDDDADADVDVGNPDVVIEIVETLGQGFPVDMALVS